MISPPTILLSPCQVLTTEQADCRVQAVIDIYRQREETSWTLPTTERHRTNVAFSDLRRRVEAVEGALIKICMFFDDSVLHNVVAIVVCAHQQRELYAASHDDEASTHYFLPRTVMESMSAYLDSVFFKLYYALTWIQSGEGKHHVRTVNEAIRDMHLSLRRYNCQHVCNPDATPSAHASAPSFGAHALPVLPDCRELCGPRFGIEDWPQNFDHLRRIDINAAPDWTLRDRNWVPMTVPLEQYLAQSRELRRRQSAPYNRTTSPLQRFLASSSRDSSVDIPPTSCRRPPVASTSTDTGYGSALPDVLADDFIHTDRSSSSSTATSDTRKRRRHADDPSGDAISETNVSPRHPKRMRRHQSCPNGVPTVKRQVRRRYTTPTLLSTTCVALSEEDAMDVDHHSDALSGLTQCAQGAPGSLDDSGDDTSISASLALDEFDVMQRDLVVEPEGSRCRSSVMVDSAADGHGAGPSTWLRRLWRLFGWRG